jgi:hypothetical protein
MLSADTLLFRDILFLICVLIIVLVQKQKDFIEKNQTKTPSPQAK